MSEQLKFALALRADLNTARAGIEWVRAAGTQATELKTRLGDAPELAAIVTAAKAVIADAESIEGQLHNPEAKVVYDILRGPKGAQLYSQLAPLYSWSQTSDHAPSEAMLARWRELHRELGEREAAIAGMSTGSVARLEAAVSAARLPRLILPAVKAAAP